MGSLTLSLCVFVSPDFLTLSARGTPAAALLLRPSCLPDAPPRASPSCCERRCAELTSHAAVPRSPPRPRAQVSAALAPRTQSRVPLGALPTNTTRPRSSLTRAAPTVVARTPPPPVKAWRPPPPAADPAAAQRSAAAVAASAAIATAAVVATESQMKVVAELAEAAVQSATAQQQVPRRPKTSAITKQNSALRVKLAASGSLVDKLRRQKKALVEQLRRLRASAGKGERVPSSCGR